MKENTDEKALVKIDNTIFNKIKQLIIKIFGNNKAKKSVKENKEDKQNSNSLKISFIEDIKIDTRLQKLQEDFESRKILEKDLSKEEKNELRKLYLQKIEEKKQSIENYKNRINKIRSQLA